MESLWNAAQLQGCEGTVCGMDVMQLPRAEKKLEETLVHLFQGRHGRVLLKSQERTWPCETIDQVISFHSEKGLRIGT